VHPAKGAARASRAAKLVSLIQPPAPPRAAAVSSVRVFKPADSFSDLRRKIHPSPGRLSRGPPIGLERPHAGRERTASEAQASQRRGFPKVDGLLGGRYVPAVKAFFDREYGVNGKGHVMAPDGPTELGAWKKQRAGRQG